MSKSKGFYVSALSIICAIAIVALTSYGINSMDNTTDSKENEIAKEKFVDNTDAVMKNIEPQTTTDANKESDSVKKNNDMNLDNGEDSNQLQNHTKSNNQMKNQTNNQTQNQVKDQDKNKVNNQNKDKNNNQSKDQTNSKINSETDKQQGFKEEDGLKWPLKGNVIMNFSEKSEIYYQTLGQFMASDKILIKANQGDKVKAAAAGTIEDISSNRELGNYIVVSLGNGYKSIYGELDDVEVKKGDKVKCGQVLATVGEPSGYYEKEGCNLYFKMMKNDVALNPLTMLE